MLNETMYSKSCFVPLCNSSSASWPEKKFILVPRSDVVRREWLAAVHLAKPSLARPLYCCQDHFDMDKDVEKCSTNMSPHSKTDVLLKNGVIPHRNLPSKADLSKLEKRIEKAVHERRKPAPPKSNSVSILLEAALALENNPSINASLDQNVNVLAKQITDLEKITDDYCVNEEDLDIGSEVILPWEENSDVGVEEGKGEEMCMYGKPSPPQVDQLSNLSLEEQLSPTSSLLQLHIHNTSQCSSPTISAKEEYTSEEISRCQLFSIDESSALEEQVGTAQFADSSPQLGRENTVLLRSKRISPPLKERDKVEKSSCTRSLPSRKQYNAPEELCSKENSSLEVDLNRNLAEEEERGEVRETERGIERAGESSTSYRSSSSDDGETSSTAVTTLNGSEEGSGRQRRAEKKIFYRCEDCGFFSKYISAVKIHISDIHVSPVGRYYCIYKNCGYSVARGKSLRKHVRLAHANDRRRNKGPARRLLDNPKHSSSSSTALIQSDDEDLIFSDFMDFQDVAGEEVVNTDIEVIDLT